MICLEESEKYDVTRLALFVSQMELKNVEKVMEIVQSLDRDYDQIWGSMVKQTIEKSKMGTRLRMNEFQLETEKATEKAPISMRKIIPGPTTVPTMIMIYRDGFFNI